MIFEGTRKHTTSAHFKGFSLIQLLTVLAIVGIGLTTGVPGMVNLISTHSMNATARALQNSLFHARSEAIKSGGRVTVARANNNWSNGWRVFSDDNDDGTLNENEQLLEQFNPLGERYRLQGNRPVQSYVSYVASGQSERISGSLQMGTLTLCDSVTGTGVALVISSSGRPRIERSTAVDARCGNSVGS